jgi:error-prone DNA polymerase
MLVDRVAKAHRWFDGSRDLLKRSRDRARSGHAADRHVGHARRAAAGFPRHLSQHSGGFVISRGKLTRLVPVENAAMDGRASSSGTRTISKRSAC